MAEVVHKVTLGSGKVVLVRDPKIKHQELAAKAAGNMENENDVYKNLRVQNELVKILIAKVDDKSVSGGDTLDDLLTMSEYQQILKVVGQISGATDGAAAPLIEVVSSGVK